MLLNFKASNARSFRDEVHLSFVASRLAESGVVRHERWREGEATVPVLPVLGIFGANASGKTNALRSLHDMRQLVVGSFTRSDPEGGLDRRHFALGDGDGDIPTTYEISMILDGVRHDYGFQLDDARIVAEWATWHPKGKAATLFIRDGNEMYYGPRTRSRGRSVADVMRPNALFLSAAGAAAYEPLVPLYRWFTENLDLAEASNRWPRLVYSSRLQAAGHQKQPLIALLRAADLGIVDVTERPLDPKLIESVNRVVRALSDEVGDIPDIDVAVAPVDLITLQLAHQGKRGPVPFDLEDESLGTQVWLGLLGPVIDALSSGTVLLVDELDSSLHPDLVAQLVWLFQNQASNPLNAQLVFNAFDPDLLGDSVGDRILGRDQIWFTEKLSDGATRIYPLSDWAPRKEESVRRRYREGRYGAVPIVSRQGFAAAAELVTSGATEE